MSAMSVSKTKDNFEGRACPTLCDSIFKQGEFIMLWSLHVIILVYKSLAKRNWD